MFASTDVVREFRRPSVVSNSNDRKRLNKLCEISMYMLRALAQQFVDSNKTRPLLYQYGNDSVDHMTVELVTSKCGEFAVTRRARSGNNLQPAPMDCECGGERARSVFGPHRAC